MKRTSLREAAMRPDGPPLCLKATLIRHGIDQSQLARCIRQPSGKPLHRAALNLLLNGHRWPVTTPADEIVAATESMLRQHGVPEAEIAGIWDADPGDPARHAQPQYRRPAALNDPDLENDTPETREMLSPDARKHFSLFRDPFQDDVQGADDVYLSADGRYIREAMFTTARHGGFLAVVGESGAGKTILRKDLIERINREGQAIVLIQPQVIDKTRLTAGMIFEAIIDDLVPGTPIRRSQEAKARQAQKMLTESSRAGNSHVLVIEEAHDLSVPTLKVLKRFWELEDGFRRLLAIILIGQPELKLRLDERHNYDAREVIRRCEVAELMPLDRHLEDYLAKKFQRVGADAARLLGADAYDAMRIVKGPQTRPGGVVAKPSQLYPLVVNNLVTKAMNHAAELGVPVVNGDVIRAL
jgi:type II secretory pathway predicted ATPase ExeA